MCSQVQKESGVTLLKLHGGKYPPTTRPPLKKCVQDVLEKVSYVQRLPVKVLDRGFPWGDDDTLEMCCRCHQARDRRFGFTHPGMYVNIPYMYMYIHGTTDAVE